MHQSRPQEALALSHALCGLVMVGDDPAELRRIAKTLLNAWHMQADMTRHYGAQAMGITSRTP